MSWIVIFSLILGVIIFLVFLKLNIEISILKDGTNDYVKMTFFVLGGLIKYRYEIPKIKTKEKSVVTESSLDADKEMSFEKIYIKIKGLIERYKKNKYIIKNAVRKLKRKVQVKRFSFEMVIGTSDAAHTALLTGVLWALIGNFNLILCNNLSVEKRKFRITPHYGREVLNFHFNSIFSLRIVHIIIIGIKIITIKFKQVVK